MYRLFFFVESEGFSSPLANDLLEDLTSIFYMTSVSGVSSQISIIILAWYNFNGEFRQRGPDTRQYVNENGRSGSE